MAQGIRTSPGVGQGWTLILNVRFSCCTLDLVLYQVLQVSEQLLMLNVRFSCSTLDLVLYQVLQVSEQLYYGNVCNVVVLSQHRY